MKETLQELVNKFNENADVNKKLKDIDRMITIKFSDDGTYHIHLKDGKLSDVEEGEVESQIAVEMTSEVFNGILNKEIDALTAYLTKKISINASLMDKLLIKDLFKG